MPSRAPVDEHPLPRKRHVYRAVGLGLGLLATAIACWMFGLFSPPRLAGIAGESRSPAVGCIVFPFAAVLFCVVGVISADRLYLRGQSTHDPGATEDKTGDAAAPDRDDLLRQLWDRPE